MGRITLYIVVLIVLPCAVLSEDSVKWDEAPRDKLVKLLEGIKQTTQEDVIAKEYAAVSGEFGERMIVKFINGVMGIYLTDSAAAISVVQYIQLTARSALDFLLLRTGSYKGTVEFYTPNRIKMFAISGTLLSAEITMSDFFKNHYK